MSHVLPEPRRRALRSFTVAWTIACVLLGCLCTWQVLRLQDGADALDGAGRGLQGTASSLRELEELPLVGDQVTKAADTVERGGDAARTSSDEVRSSVQLLAVLLGLAIAVLPTAPLVAMLRLLR